MSLPTGSGENCYLVFTSTYVFLRCRLKPSLIIAQTNSTSSLLNNTGSSYLVGMTNCLYTCPIQLIIVFQKLHVKWFQVSRPFLCMLILKSVTKKCYQMGFLESSLKSFFFSYRRLHSCQIHSTSMQPRSSPEADV